IRRDLGEEAGVRVAVRVERLSPGADATGLGPPGADATGLGPAGAHATGLAELADRDFAEDAQPFPRVVGEPTDDGDRGRFHRQDADGVDVAVSIEASVGTLAVPVGAMVSGREGGIGGADGGDTPFGHLAKGKALALVQTRRADQAEGRPL